MTFIVFISNADGKATSSMLSQLLESNEVSNGGAIGETRIVESVAVAYGGLLFSSSARLIVH